ncbi:MAG: polysulfide reductase NrfD [Negativicutes bacterium]|nr:polysulfide reductase NrfD [Negativicutes bacterium]
MSKSLKGIILALFIAGLAAALGKVFFWGEAATNYGAYVPWGLWVALYIFLVGTAAGAAWTGIYAAYSQGGEPKKLTSISLIIAGASLAIGLAFVGLDLGKPLKGISIFFNPSFSSKLAWASWLYLVFFGCLAGYFFTNAKKGFMYAAGVVAAGFVVAEGLFFGSMVARQLWNSLLTPVSFLTSSLAAGSAAVLTIGILSTEETIAEEGVKLPKLVMLAVILHAGVEAVHAVAGAGIEARAMLSSWIYLGVFGLFGVIVPLALLKKGNRMSLAPFALILAGFVAYKYAFVRYGFTAEPLPGLVAALQDAKLTMSYIPSTVEWVVSIGMLAGVIWIADFAINKLTAKERV